MATKQKFVVEIAGTDYSQYVNYPVSETVKNLEESLNLAEITLTRMTQSEPFKPNRAVYLEVYADNVEQRSSDWLIMSDLVTKIGYTNKYEHKLTLIEYTQMLNQIILPNFTITRARVAYEPTLYDVAARIRNLIAEKIGITFSFTTEVQTKLDSIESPEWTFTRQTALECLRVVFGYAELVPYAFIDRDNANVKTLGGVAVLEELSGSIEGFSHIQEAYNPETYKTALHTNVQNMITGENDTITEPANGWLSVRSPDGYKIQADNAYIPTSRPIYKVDNFVIARYVTVSKLIDASTIVSEAIPHSVIPAEWYIDLEDIVYEKDFWDTRENTDVLGERGASFYYTQNKPGIHNLTYIPPARWSWDPTAQAWKNVVDGLPTASGSNLNLYIKAEYVAAAEAAAITYWESLHTPYNDVDLFWISYTPEIDSPYTGPSTQKISDMQFRITYTPFIDTDIYTFRERKFNDDDEVLSVQNYNQQSTITNSDVLGVLHDKVIKRGSGTSLTVTYMHKNFSDILPIGRRIEEYIITSLDLTYGQYGITVIYNLDKYYAKLQKYVAILEEYRQYSIPKENIVTRQLTLNRFAKFSDTKTTSISELDATYYIGDNTNEINLMKVSNATIPTTNFAFNNSLIFEGTLESNSTAGPQSAVFDADTRVDSPTIYTDEYGRIEEHRTIKFGRDFTSFGLTDSHNLPQYAGNLSKEFYTEYLYLEKDAREILSVSLQIHSIDTTGKIYINKAFAKQNGLAGGDGLNSSDIKVAFFNSKPHVERIVGAADIELLGAATFSESTNSIILPTITNSETYAFTSWGCVKDLGDSTYEILFWVDEIVLPSNSATQYYINFKDSY